jgi:hypothetical protein
LLSLICKIIVYIVLQNALLKAIINAKPTKIAVEYFVPKHYSPVHVRTTFLYIKEAIKINMYRVGQNFYAIKQQN